MKSKSESFLDKCLEAPKSTTQEFVMFNEEKCKLTSPESLLRRGFGLYLYEYRGKLYDTRGSFVSDDEWETFFSFFHDDHFESMATQFADVYGLELLFC